MSKKNSIFGLLFCVLVTWSGKSISHDDAIYVSINPMSCVPTEETIRDKKYLVTAGRVAIKKGIVGRITFICPIGPIHSPDNKEFKNSEKADALGITMNYYNQTSSATIWAAVRSANLINGAVKTVIEVNSLPLQGFSGANGASFARTSNSGAKLDFTKNTYWVQFSLNRDRIAFSTPGDTAPEEEPVELRFALLNIGLKIASLKH